MKSYIVFKGQKPISQIKILSPKNPSFIGPRNKTRF
ncbi:hypothetical protein NC651_012487 [Populus alba x Populus x berolinensis]|nr:hypothetical protein NC651_012487 [Populus alba x Populus x berolinensis]